jgi:hypothetical protein
MKLKMFYESDMDLRKLERKAYEGDERDLATWRHKLLRTVYAHITVPIINVIEAAALNDREAIEMLSQLMDHPPQEDRDARDALQYHDNHNLSDEHVTAFLADCVEEAVTEDHDAFELISSSIEAIRSRDADRCRELAPQVVRRASEWGNGEYHYDQLCLATWAALKTIRLHGHGQDFVSKVVYCLELLCGRGKTYVSEDWVNQCLADYLMGRRGFNIAYQSLNGIGGASSGQIPADYSQFY